MIKISNLTKYYGSKKALDDISFELQDGKIYGFLGPNGAGKSTTMNIMTGYIGATSGTVNINGYDIMQEPEKAKLNIGYLPEIPPLYTDMTVEEYLNFVAELKHVPKDGKKEHIREIEEKTGVFNVRNRLIKYLSKGYRQRTGFAAALVSYPDVIILDEPTVGLDPVQLNEMRDLIRSLREKHTVILSSHIMQEVSAVCDIILIIVNGKLVANDTPENLSRLNSKSTILKYRVKGNRDDVCRVLGNKSDQCVIKEEDGLTVFDLPLDAAEIEKVQTELFYGFAENRLPVLECRVEERSLENIFLDYAGIKEVSDESHI